MSSNIYDFFTDVEVLKSREPEYFKCRSGLAKKFTVRWKNSSIIGLQAVDVGDISDEEPLRVPCNGNVSRRLKEQQMQALPTVVKTFVSILDEGCKKYYDGAAPVYSSVDCPDRIDMFVVRCELRDMVASGRAKTKKAAKQLAAKEILLQIAEKGNFLEFALGKSKEAAVNYLQACQQLCYSRNSLMPELSAPEEDAEGTATENWIGKINERLLAKMLAAQEMYKRLEESNDWTGNYKDELEATMQEKDQAVETLKTSENEGTPVVSMSESEDRPPEVITLTEMTKTEEKPSSSSALTIIREVLNAGANSEGAEAKLERIMNDENSVVESVFAKRELSFTVVTQPDVNGNLQCLLKVIGPNGEANVFGGTGRTEQASRDSAARAAFVYLDTFIHAVSKTEQPQ
ncbi:unnamed protein product [Toxocara canis]|uniref:DRBM domain-containing protein n=1 Tax=Toxocara canis TaxID=6265 RepID=A0A183V949_TOXCA|nr:unnamed protein product [Toxocara canis]